MQTLWLDRNVAALNNIEDIDKAIKQEFEKKMLPLADGKGVPSKGVSLPKLQELPYLAGLITKRICLSLKEQLKSDKGDLSTTTQALDYMLDTMIMGAEQFDAVYSLADKATTTIETPCKLAGKMVGMATASAVFASSKCIAQNLDQMKISEKATTFALM